VSGETGEAQLPSPHLVRILWAVRIWFILLLLVTLTAGDLLTPEPAVGAADDGLAALGLSLACQTDPGGSADEVCCDQCGHVCCLPGAVATVSSVVTIPPPQLITAPTTALREGPVPVLLEPPRLTPLH
jgi:hypothetical protein